MTFFANTNRPAFRKGDKLMDVFAQLKN